MAAGLTYDCTVLGEGRPRVCVRVVVWTHCASCFWKVSFSPHLYGFSCHIWQQQGVDE